MYFNIHYVTYIFSVLITFLFYLFLSLCFVLFSFFSSLVLWLPFTVSSVGLIIPYVRVSLFLPPSLPLSPHSLRHSIISAWPQYRLVLLFLLLLLLPLFLRSLMYFFPAPIPSFPGWCLGQNGVDLVVLSPSTHRWMLGFVSALVGGEERRREGESSFNTCRCCPCHLPYNLVTTTTTTAITTTRTPAGLLYTPTLHARLHGGVTGSCGVVSSV